ncbi:hypothetical protein ABMA28_001873 [Loxostege sticticalis]|uniref:Uncharacterized protein n=1 Tax=Loxostege sticticalis TaxID=481309 RepID=A0ABD0SZ78_LOXSC
MLSLQKSIEEVKEMCASRIQEFQQNLDKAVSSTPAATTTITTLAADFTFFKHFVTTTLTQLQHQADLLAQECDRMEMRSRRKIVLIHGLPEDRSEDPCGVVLRTLSEHLKLPLTKDSIRRCHRLGRSTKHKPRPVLVKFASVADRDKVWFGKTAMKGTGVTFSEFLTPGRHNVFMEARRRVGVSKCWTRNGSIIVIGAEDKHHRITTLSELVRVCGPPTASLPTSKAQPSTSTAVGVKGATSGETGVKTRRGVKK